MRPPPPPRRIALHLGSNEWGGAEQELARLGAALQGRGHQLRVYCNQPGHVARFREHGLPAQLAPLGGDAAVHHAIAFALRLRGFRPHVLLVGTFKKLWLAGLAGRLARVPQVLVRVVLQSDVPRNPKYRASLTRLVDAVVPNAAEQEPPFLALPGWSARRVRTIYNYYQPAPPAGHDLRAELGLGPDVPVVGAVARLAPQKKLFRLVEAVGGMPGVHCVLAGDGPRRPQLEALAAELGARDRVHFLGHRDDVPAVLATLDAFVVCSDREGMSNAMLEAMAAGVPVVSTPVSGAREALEPLPDGTAPGLIVPGEPAALRAALQRILDDAALAASMRAAARRRLETRFAPAAILDQWEALLAETV